jgi:hypothetical protein
MTPVGWILGIKKRKGKTMSLNKETIKELHAKLRAGGSNISLERLREINMKKGLSKEQLKAELERKEKGEE